MESHWFLYIFVLMAVQDGTLRIFEWPSMKTILNESNAHGEVKNLTFRCAFSYQIRKLCLLQKVVHSIHEKGIIFRTMIVKRIV